MENFINAENSTDANFSSHSDKKHIGISGIFDNLLHGIAACSHKFFGMENHHSIDDKKAADEKYAQIQSEVSELKELKMESFHHLQEYKRKAKQLNLLEVRAKLAQIKQNKKKFSKFWKQH